MELHRSELNGWNAQDVLPVLNVVALHSPHPSLGSGRPFFILCQKHFLSITVHSKLHMTDQELKNLPGFGDVGKQNRSEPDPLYLIQRDLVPGAIVQPRGLRGLVCGDCARPQAPRRWRGSW